MKRILVADDDSSVLSLIARSLTDYEVTTAGDGLEALALGHSLDAIDLLITDYMMPAITGDELAGRLRAVSPKMKTLLVTGHGAFIEPDMRVTDGLLAKPFGPAVLRATVAGLIGAPTSSDTSTN